MIFAFVFALTMQTPDPVLTEWQSALSVAQASGDMEATIGRLTGTEDRVVLCTLDGAVTRLRCFHSTQRMVDDVEVANHSAPNDYDGQPLADILAAEKAWGGAVRPSGRACSRSRQSRD